MSRRDRHLDALDHRLVHLERQVANTPDGAMMYARRELAAIRYALAMLRHLSVEPDWLAELELHAYMNDEIGSADLSDEARARLPRGGRHGDTRPLPT